MAGKYRKLIGIFTALICCVCVMVLVMIEWTSISFKPPRPQDSYVPGENKTDNVCNNFSEDINLERPNEEQGKTLVDVRRNFGPYIAKCNHSTCARQHAIIYYNWQKWVSKDYLNQIFKSCEYDNCYMTDDRRLIDRASAVIFHLIYGKSDLTDPPDVVRNHKQPWILLNFESPLNVDSSPLKSEQWSSVFNWTMNYRFDSDIHIPNGFLESREGGVNKSFHAIFDNKLDTMAVWIASNCETDSDREGLVKELIEHNVTVDVFGKCGKKTVKDAAFISKYKFYFAFENSLCKDYITEKFFLRYNQDLILVTYGGSDYRKLLPTNTFINVADFETVSELAKFMITLANDRDMYTDFLKRKDMYVAQINHPTSWALGFCNLCEKVNNVDSYNQSYDNITTFLDNDQCWMNNLRKPKMQYKMLSANELDKIRRKKFRTIIKKAKDPCPFSTLFDFPPC